MFFLSELIFLMISNREQSKYSLTTVFHFTQLSGIYASSYPEEKCSQNPMGNNVFKQISLLIKLFDDIRKLDNDHGGAFVE